MYLFSYKKMCYLGFVNSSLLISRRMFCKRSILCQRFLSKFHLMTPNYDKTLRINAFLCWRKSLDFRRAANKRFICSTISLFRRSIESSTVDLKAAQSKLIDEAQEKIENAKNKLDNVKHQLIGDIHDTKEKMQEKIDDIIQRENILTIPNLLCTARLLATPVLCYLVLHNNYDVALGLFLFAGLTDLVDGWIARTFPSQASKFGSFLDPLADKVLVATLFLSLTYNGMIPGLLTTVIILRDALLISSASYLRYKTLPSPRTLARYFDATHATVQLAPTTISKVNTAVQLSLVTATLAQPVLEIPSPGVLTAIWVGTAFTTVASGFSYLISKNTYKLLDSSCSGQTASEADKR